MPRQCFTDLLFILIVTLVIRANADTRHVDVGRIGPFFEPNILYNVAEGDVINFHFYPSNHSVAESTFDRPCKPKPSDDETTALFSGFVPVSKGVADKMWIMTVTTTDPIWLYCSQGARQHCRSGQSMVINPINDTEQTLDAYMEAAQKANVTSPVQPFGGNFVDDDGGSAQQGSRTFPTSVLSPSATQSSKVVVKPTTTKGIASALKRHERLFGLWTSVVVIFITIL